MMDNSLQNEITLDYLNNVGEETKAAYNINGTPEPSFLNTTKKAEEFVNKVVQLIKEEGLTAGSSDKSKKVVNFQHPASLKKLLDLNITAEATDEESLLELCKLSIKYSVQTQHPYFFNQLYGGVDPYGMAGAWLTEALNTNQHTYEVAPVFIIVEKTILSHIQDIVGWKCGDGIFSPGGSISNMYGMVLARYKMFPETKTKGICGLNTLVCFTSQDSHYSIVKGAHWLGIGSDNVVKVKTDGQGRMIPEELENAIIQAREEGKIPFFVNATSGTTVLGAFDPLEAVADVCAKHGLWLHVDACWGGGALVSKHHRYLMKGIERADSLSWNLHKMLCAPLQCSALIVKEKGLLYHANSASATYLFQQDKFYDVSYDTGDKSIQCGRKTDGFKLWLMWKARGDEQFGALVDNAIECARYFAKKISKRDGFRLVLPDTHFANVCFWYIPPSLRGQDETEEWWDKLEKVAPKMKENMILDGTLMIGYQPLAHKGWRNFFRLVISCHPPPTYELLDYVIGELERQGKNL